MDDKPQRRTSAEKSPIPRLDLKDRKILLALSTDARMPLSGIAKFAGLSRDSVKYRIEGYRRSGLLINTATLVDVTRLGYDSYHIFLRLFNPSEEVEGDIIARIGKIPYVRVILKFMGEYDLEIVLVSKDLAQFDMTLTGILSDFSRMIKDYEILVVTKPYITRPIPPVFFGGIKSDGIQVNPKRKRDAQYMPDDKDFEILRQIRDDARMPLVEIAEKIGMSKDAVSYRLKKLEGSIILDFLPVVSYRMLGYEVHALLLNISPLDKESDKKLEKFLANNGNILFAVKTVGRFNVLVYVCTQNISGLQEVINELRREFAEQIKNFESLFAFERQKYTYAPDCVFE